MWKYQLSYICCPALLRKEVDPMAIDMAYSHVSWMQFDLQIAKCFLEKQNQNNGQSYYDSYLIYVWSVQSENLWVIEFHTGWVIWFAECKHRIRLQKCWAQRALTKPSAFTEWLSSMETPKIMDGVSSSCPQTCGTGLTQNRVFSFFMLTRYIWMFPEIVGTPKSSILVGFPIINHPFRVPLFLETPMYTYIYIYICIFTSL